MIHKKITEKKVNFEKSTGKQARYIYLGSDDMKDLLRWAEQNQYIPDCKKANIEGLSRPEVCGLVCFEVNADRHIECA